MAKFCTEPLKLDKMYMIIWISIVYTIPLLVIIKDGLIISTFAFPSKKVFQQK